jgi:hypothetical protein
MEEVDSRLARRREDRWTSVNGGHGPHYTPGDFKGLDQR